MGGGPSGYGKAGQSAGDGLGIALHLVSMLPTIPIEPAFNTVTPELPGYTPRSLAYASQGSIDCGAISVLGEELLRDPTREDDQTMQTSRVMATHTVSTRFATTEGTGDDHPGPGFSPHSPTYSPSHSPFRSYHSDSMDNGPTSRIPVCRVLTARSLVNQHPTPKHL